MSNARPPQGAAAPSGGSAAAPAASVGAHIRWPAEAIWEQIGPLLPGFSVEVLPQLGSTNTELMQRARAGQWEPVLLVAEQQTAGRGRLGRQWHSGAGDALTFSLGLPLAPTDWSGLSLVVGAVVAEALHPAIGLKWPNDLWWQDRKLGGILIETVSVIPAEVVRPIVIPAKAGIQSPLDPRSRTDDSQRRYTVIGIGLNIVRRSDSGLSTPSAALQELLPGVSAPEVLQRIAEPLVRAVQAFETYGFRPFQARFNTLDVLSERAVILTDGTTGTAHGVSEAGALLVHTAAGMMAVTSAEVSVRPA